LNVVLGEKHHADTLKGALNRVGRNSVRLPPFQFEIVDVALAHRSALDNLLTDLVDRTENVLCAAVPKES
jgi:hypothetical protein